MDPCTSCTYNVYLGRRAALGETPRKREGKMRDNYYSVLHYEFCLMMI
jgi:hypothetical protein